MMLSLASISKLVRRKEFLLILLLLLPLSVSAQPLQSHPLSEIYPIDVNLNMQQKNITNVSYYFLAGGRYVYDTGSAIGLSSGLLLGGNLNLNSFSLIGGNWINASSFNASTICLGGICQTSWPSGLSGSGTPNYLPIWSTSTSLTDSLINQTGGSIWITSGNLNILSGALQIAGTNVITYSKNIVNVTWVNATNINASNTIRATTIYQGNNQVIDTISQAGPILVTGTGSSRTINLSTPLALNYGGTGAILSAVAGGIVYSTSSSLAISSAGSPGQILVSGGSGAPSWTSSLTLSGLTVDTNTLYIDTVNHRVGIGTTSPQNKLNVIGDLNVTGIIYGTLNGPYNPSGDLDMGGNKIYNASFIHTRGFGVASDLTTAENNKPSGYSVYVQDHVRVGGNILGAGADIAERVFVDGSLEAGDVVIIIDNLKVSKSYKPYDTSVAGVISTKPHYILAEERDGKPLALAGIVPVKVTIENGVIKVGDLLTTSSKPGYAMKCDDVQKCRGAIIGKAMQNAYSDGKIEVLVMLA